MKQLSAAAAAAGVRQRRYIPPHKRTHSHDLSLFPTEHTNTSPICI
jgi:hypothetical protein